MEDDEIIRDRVAISEVLYKRLLKISQAVCVGDDGAAFHSEFLNYRSMLTKLQLQINASERERDDYETQRVEFDKQIDLLKEKTATLQGEWDEARQLRSQRQEYNAIVDAMIKPKKVKVRDDDGKEVPIIALLNSSRNEDEKEIDECLSEIEELKAQKAELLEMWNARRTRFEQVVQTIQNFKDEVMKVDLEEEGDEELEAQESDDDKMDTTV